MAINVHGDYGAFVQNAIPITETKKVKEQIQWE